MHRSIDALKNIVRDTDKTYVEVGVSRGTNLVDVANTFTNLEAIYGIDAYEPYKDTMVGNNYIPAKLIELIKTQALQNINLCNAKDKIQLLVDRSENVITSFKNNSMDVVFIDTVVNTDEFVNQVHSWLNKVSDKGILCGHDWYVPYVQKTVKNVLKDLGYDNRYKVSLDTIWYIVK